MKVSHPTFLPFTFFNLLPRSLMECVMLLSISSTIAFLVNYSLIGKTWLEYVNSNLVVVSMLLLLFSFI